MTIKTTLCKKSLSISKIEIISSKLQITSTTDQNIFGKIQVAISGFQDSLSFLNGNFDFLSVSRTGENTKMRSEQGFPNAANDKELDKNGILASINNYEYTIKAGVIAARNDIPVSISDKSVFDGNEIQVINIKEGETSTDPNLIINAISSKLWAFKSGYETKLKIQRKNGGIPTDNANIIIIID